MFIIRFILAATLSSNYGIYGGAYEFLENKPQNDETNTYYRSEKKEIKAYPWTQWTPFKNIIQQVNQIRKTNRALQFTFNVELCECNNEHIITYLKTTQDLSNIIFVVVNLDPYNKQAATTRFPYEKINCKVGDELEMHDLITDKKYTWNSEWSYVELHPFEMPFHLFQVWV